MSSTVPNQTATLVRTPTSTTSATILAAGGSRKAFVIVNDSAGVLTVAFSTSAASATNFTVKIAANSYYESPQPVYGGAVQGVLDTGTGNAQVSWW